MHRLHFQIHQIRSANLPPWYNDRAACKTQQSMNNDDRKRVEKSKVIYHWCDKSNIYWIDQLVLGIWGRACSSAFCIIHRPADSTKQGQKITRIKKKKPYKILMNSNLSFLPENMFPSITFNASCALASEAKVTNPYERVFPVVLFLLILASNSVPKGENSCSKSVSLANFGKSPTNREVFAKFIMLLVVVSTRDKKLTAPKKDDDKKFK